MKSIRSYLFFVVASLIAISQGTAFAQNTFVVTPQTPVWGTGEVNQPNGGMQVVGVALDAASGFDFGSLKTNGLKKSDIYLSPEMLFGREVLVGEVESMRFSTKKGTTHVVDPRDWYLLVYTKRYLGQLGTSFYGTRSVAVPAYSAGLIEQAGSWVEWNTHGSMNRLRWAESTYNNFGGYNDPDWSTHQSGMSLAGSRGPGVPMATQPILYFSLQTGSGSESAGLMAQLDGLEIVLSDGSWAKVNMEPFEVPTDKDRCKDGGWKSVYMPDGTPFKNQGHCVSFTNR